MTNTSILNIETLQSPWKAQDPFLFCAYHRDEYPKGNEGMGLNPEQMRGRNVGQDFMIRDGFRMYHGSMVPGFPYHPHRGFETVTIAVEGVVDHSDSLGGAGRFKDGDVQWLTAGRGVQHSEMFPLVNADKDNPFELFQIWLNLPSKSKMTDPHYKMLWKENIPVARVKDGDKEVAVVDVIAGDFNGVEALEPNPNSWAADPANGVAIYTIKLAAGAELTIPAAASGLNRNLYFYRGDSIEIEGQSVRVNSRVSLSSDQEVIIQNGDEVAYFLFLQGKPIGEPVAQYGPFVMNTEQEIREAFAEYQETEFGGWPWPMKEQVWERSKGRFARYADGSEESR